MFLPGESQGRGSLVGCRLWGRTESETTEVTQQQQQQQQQGTRIPQAPHCSQINKQKSLKKLKVCLGDSLKHESGKLEGSCPVIVSAEAQGTQGFIESLSVL